MALEFLLLVAGLGGIVFFFIRETRKRTRWGLNLARTQCPACGTDLPRIRHPRSFRQAMWGGTTCPGCGVELDKWGRRTGDDKT